MKKWAPRVLLAAALAGLSAFLLKGDVWTFWTWWMDQLPKVLGGLGIAILSTNKGVITDKEARKLQVGGEVLAFVW